MNSTELLYVGNDNHLHLVTGLPAPSATTPTNPCGAVAGQNSVIDTDLSAKAIDSVTSTTDTNGTYADENPDWSPDGTKIVFDSTRGGTNHTLWQMTNITSGTTTVTPLWPTQVGPAGGSGRKSSTEPVYSPDGNYVAFVQPGQGVNTWTGMIVGMNQGLSSSEDVSLSTQGNGIINDQPDWGPSATAEHRRPRGPFRLDAAGQRPHPGWLGPGLRASAAGRSLTKEASLTRRLTP